VSSFDTVTFFDQDLGNGTGDLEVEIGVIKRFDFASTTDSRHAFAC
jgi:hypothetical protein